ncbi:MAG: substrate-binding domain-containing protein [Magnetococcales bacterium]|nr:substrate-binding domain-containing protein [Magnetococcales bacterium]
MDLSKPSLPFLLFTLALLTALPLPAQGRDTLQGAPFTDPDLTLPKSAAWSKRPIQYADWADKADMAAVLDQHLYPALLPMIQTFAREKKWDIAVKEGTCGTSQGMLNQKKVDIAGFCCPPGLGDRMPGLTFHTMGIASLAILVHPDNPVESLTRSQVEDIFQGHISKWSDIPTPSGKSLGEIPIKPVARLHCKTRPGHWRLILDNENLYGPQISEVGTIPEMIASVGDYKGAIGYEVIWDMNRYRDKGRTKPIKIDGLSPFSSLDLAAGRYPFYRTYNITSWSASGIANERATELVKHLEKNLNRIDSGFHLVPTLSLRKNGWQFRGNELIGEPE